MNMPKDIFSNNSQQEIMGSREVFIENLEKSIEKLEIGIEEAEGMIELCTPEWCRATENMMDELSNRISSISEPAWTSDKDTHKLKELKRRLHDVYARYKHISQP